jgi:hypothetical protein
LICDRCSVARKRYAAARCRFCPRALCSEHLDDMLTPRSGAEAGCRHVFVATGWLERALRR